MFSKMCSKKFENRSTNKSYMCKINFYCSIVKKVGREVTIFPENFEGQNILSKMLEINIKYHERLTCGSNF